MRRVALASAALFVAGLLLAGCGKPEAGRLPAVAEHPNIILVVIDSLRADRLGVYGGERDLTPTMDEIAADGLAFDRVIAQAPWTQPSVASLFCSYHPGVHKVLNYGVAVSGPVPGQTEVSVFSDKFTTLAEALHDQGYQTAAFCANPFVVPGYGFAQGFDHFDASFADNQTPGEVITDAAVEWLKRRDASRPCFVYLHMMDAHGPYEGDIEYLAALLDQIEQMPDKHKLTAEEADRLEYLRRLPSGVEDPDRHACLEDYREYWAARYDAAVHRADTCVADLRQRLTELGLWDGAYFVLTADHGEALCEHHFWGHGYSAHHNQLQVPLILHWPGRLPAGQRVSSMVRLIDLMPTMLDQLRLPPVAGVQGTSLLALIQQRPTEQTPMAFAECVNLGTEQKALYRGDLKLLYVASQPPQVQLFNVASDPYEQSALPALFDGMRDEMMGLLRRQLAHDAALTPIAQETRVTIGEQERRRLESFGYLDLSEGQEDGEEGEASPAP